MSNKSSYIAIPYHIFKEENLNRRQKMLFGILNGFLHKQESVKFSNKKLAEKNASSIKKVQMDLEVLEKRKYIKRLGHSQNRLIFRGELFFKGGNILTSHPPKGGATHPHMVAPNKDTPYYINNKYNNKPPGGGLVFSLNENKINSLLSQHYENIPTHLKPNLIEEHFVFYAKVHIKKRMEDKGISFENAFKQFQTLTTKHIFKAPLGVEFKKTISMEDVKKNEAKNKERNIKMEIFSLNNFLKSPVCNTDEIKKNILLDIKKYEQELLNLKKIKSLTTE